MRLEMRHPAVRLSDEGTSGDCVYMISRHVCTVYDGICDGFGRRRREDDVWYCSMINRSTDLFNSLLSLAIIFLTPFSQRGRMLTSFMKQRKKETCFIPALWRTQHTVSIIRMWHLFFLEARGSSYLFDSPRKWRQEI